MSADTLNSTTYNNVAANTVNGAVLDAAAILAWRQDVKAVVDQHATEIDGKATKTQASWSAPTLLNGWINAGGTSNTAGYYKDEFGVVHFKGLIALGIASPGTTLFTLPSAYRPSADFSFPVVSNDGAADLIGRVVVTATGFVNIQSGGNALLSLDSISYRV